MGGCKTRERKVGREFSILPFFHHPNQTPREKTKIYSIPSTFPFSIFSLFHYSNQLDLNWAFFLFFLLCLWAKDIWVEINFIFIVFDLVKIEGMENPWGGGGGGETKVGERTLLVFSCLVGSGKWVVLCTSH